MASKSIPQSDRRIKILTDDEITELYSRPQFTPQEQEDFFSFSPKTLDTIDESGFAFKSKLYLMLLLGYFYAKPVVGHFTLKSASKDLQYLCQRYFPGKRPTYQPLSAATQSRVTQTMLQIANASKLDGQIKPRLIERLEDVATICAEPRYLFDECLAFVSQHSLALPGYTILQDIISGVLISEQARLISILSHQMDDVTKQVLQNIIYTPGELSKLSGYRGAARDFSKRELDRELGTHETIRPIYSEIKRLVNFLGISQQNKVYYASLIRRQSIDKIKRYERYQGLLYLLCYLYFRFRQANDTLSEAFIYKINKLEESAKEFAKKKIFEDFESLCEELPTTGTILDLLTGVTEQVSDDQRVKTLRSNTYKIMARKSIIKLSQRFQNDTYDIKELEWQYVDKHQGTVSNVPRQLFMALGYSCHPSKEATTQLISSVKQAIKQGSSPIEIDKRFITKTSRPYLEQNQKRNEFYLYKLLKRMAENQELYIEESETHRSLESDLIDIKKWVKDKGHLIEKSGLDIIKTPISEHLTQLMERLNSLLNHAMAHINDNLNEFVTYNKKQQSLEWHRAHQKSKDDFENPIYNQLSPASIIDVIRFTNEHLNFMRAFNAKAAKKRGARPQEDSLIAGILAEGGGYGYVEMAKQSDRTIDELRAIRDTYIAVENVDTACDMIADGIAKLPIFENYTINKEMPLGSVDGQKFQCTRKTLKARYSSKYFKECAGVSSMSLVTNHVPIASETISPNQHESWFLFDLLFNNDSSIKPKAVASDQHGSNCVNHGILNIFSYKYTPRYANFKQVFLNNFTISFGNKGIRLKVKKPINWEIIESGWDNTQRIICSLSRKTAKQSTIIKKLSRSRASNQYAASLKEYDRLVKLIYLLEYLDDKTLREFIQSALCRGEAYHQLKRTVADMSGKAFRGGNDYDLACWDNCARLITNCIIYYNSVILSRLKTASLKRNHPKSLELITQSSPAAWIHIMIGGYFHFHNGKAKKLDVQQLIKDIEFAEE